MCSSPGETGRRPLWRAGLRAARALVLGLAVLAVPRLATAQDGIIAGTVYSEGQLRPIAGAQVSVADQAGKGAVSDASGRFRITGVSGSQVSLNVRMIGYRAATQTVRVGATDVRFVLGERPVELDQIVVTGTAGGQEKRAIGNSVANVDAANVVASSQVASVQDLINGRAPGVTIMPGTGMVGSGSRIRIRGATTFSLSGEPLIYVDGVRVNNEQGSGNSIQGFGSGVISRLNDFNPEEIESIEILKGPAAATLYGTEAARGVINIITKKGASTGTQYGFNVKRGQQMFWNYENKFPTNYWVNPRTGVIEGVDVAKNELARGTPIFRKGKIESYGANVSGGAGQLRYFGSAETSDEQGAEPNNGRKQFSGRTNLQITPSSKVDVNTSLGYVNSHTTLSCEGGCGGAMWGTWYSNPANLPQNLCITQNNAFGCDAVRGFQSSPPESDRQMREWQDINRFTGSAALNFRPFSWMTHRLTVGTDFAQEKNEELLPYLTNDTLRIFWSPYADGWKYANRREVVLNTYDYVSTLRFDVTPKINSSTSGGVQYYQKHISSMTSEGDFFPAPGLETISSAAQKVTTLDGILDNNTLGFYVQQQFGWQDRLFVTGAVRVDNNSAFGKDIKWVTYPKFSLSWVLNEEPVVKERMPSFINTFKLRAAYGQSGQQPDIFTALRTYTPVPGPGGSAALTPGVFGNASLAPERGIETELGFDSGFLDDRFGLDFTYYHTLTKDAILARGVAPSTGFGSANQFVNAGAILNQGMEALLKAQVLTGQRFGWDLNFNISHNWAKVQKLSGTDTTIIVGSIQHRIGYQPWGWFRERVVSADYDPVTKKAVNAMCDNGKGGSTPCFNANGGVIAPRVYLGRVIPATEGSVGSTWRLFERFRVNALVDFKTGYRKSDNNLRIRCQIFNTCLERMHPETTDPKALAGMQTNGTIVDWVLNDGSFAKLREVSVSYDAPEKYTRYLSARGATLNFAARNLHTWTKYTGLDPENGFLSGGNNVDQAELPQLMQFVFTLHLNY
jgi:TonB-linked SusC/RagA family outer membrane protein